MRRLFFLLLCLCPTMVFADKFEATANYELCFTPTQNCTNLIVNAINQAKSQILVQAYSFTSVPIARAIINAHRKGVEVKVILDKSQYRPHGFSAAKLLTDYQIPTFIDYQFNIAHNKVIIIDNQTVVTGSFNFTRAAEERNLENVIIITDHQIAKRYAANWHERFKQSKPAALFSQASY